jgi:hypothetical protein
MPVSSAHLAVSDQRLSILVQQINRLYLCICRVELSGLGSGIKRSFNVKLA